MLSLVFATVGTVVVLGNYALNDYVPTSTIRGRYNFSHFSSPIRDSTTQYGNNSTTPQWTNASVHETVENDVQRGSYPLIICSKFLVYVYNSSQCK